MPLILRDAAERLRVLEERAGENRALLDFPQRPWVVPRRAESGEPILNVLVAGAEVLLARKIVLATGMEGAGRWYTPPLLHELPKPYWAHASEAIDFAALRGRHVAVLGGAATAMDNAAAALDHGASAVEQYCR